MTDQLPEEHPKIHLPRVDDQPPELPPPPTPIDHEEHISYQWLRPDVVNSFQELPARDWPSIVFWSILLIASLIGMLLSIR